MVKLQLEVKIRLLPRIAIIVGSRALGFAVACGILSEKHAMALGERMIDKYVPLAVRCKARVM